MNYTTEVPKATFKDGISVTRGWAVVYPANPDTGEYLGEPTMDFFMVGVSPAAYAYLDEPVLLKGRAIVRDPVANVWIDVEDHRGEVFWLKDTKERVEIRAYGALSDEFTPLEPGPMDVWGGKGWIIDDALLNNQLAGEKSYIQSTVLSKSEILRTKVSLGDASEEDKTTLRALLSYLDAVNSVKVENGTYKLPEAPEYLKA